MSTENPKSNNSPTSIIGAAPIANQGFAYFKDILNKTISSFPKMDTKDDKPNKSPTVNKTITNLQGNAKQMFEKASVFVTKSSGVQQLLIGTASGWCTGFLVTRAGKVVALSAGGTVVLIAAASQTGLINVNWDKLNKKIENASGKLENKVVQNAPNLQKNLARYGRNNTYFAAGFVGGFLLGLAS